MIRLSQILALLALAGVMADATTVVIPINAASLITATAGAMLMSEVDVLFGGQSFSLALDAGFDWTMVSSTACNASVSPLCEGDGPKYSVTNNQTTPFSAKYGFGVFGVNGVVTKDTVQYGLQGPIVPDDEFAAISSYTVASPSLIPEGITFSGSVGWAYPGKWSSLNFVTNLKAAGQITDQLFSISLPSNITQGPSRGSLTVGGYSVPDGAQVNWFTLGSSAWAGHPGLYYWSNKLSSLALTTASNTSSLNCGSCNFFFDTASGGLVLAGFPSSFTVAADCSGIAQLPTVVISIAGVPYPFEPKDYVMNINGKCYSTITATPSIAFSVLGSTWFQKYPTVFDIDNKRMGVITATTSF